MTDRLKGCVVMFEEDIREDDAAAVLSAIKMLKGVGDVAPTFADYDDWMNRSRIRLELARKLMEVLYPPEEKK